MEFKKYQHLERVGTTEVKNITEGECYIFPKIDGTNASIWIDEEVIQAGSRNRHLSLDEDNAKFLEWVLNQENIYKFLSDYPHLRLHGEWLVPHTLKTYTEDAWRKFYVFDVRDSEDKYLHFQEYSDILDEYNIDYIYPICKVTNPTYDRLIDQLEKNTFLIQDGCGVGEGIVIKNYDYVNRFGNVVWAKIVKNDFKVQNQKLNGVAEIKEKKLVEEEIVNKYITESLVEKEYSKIESVDGWSTRFIPKLLNVVFYSLIKEESWNFVKDHKNPIIDFGTLKSITILKIKEIKPELF